MVDNVLGSSYLSNTAAVVRWFVAPADHYKGQVSIGRFVNGVYYRVVGEQIPPGTPVCGRSGTASFLCAGVNDRREGRGSRCLARRRRV